MSWLPSYPQFNKNSLLFGEEAKDEGDDSNEAILQKAIESVKNKDTQFAIEDPDLRKTILKHYLYGDLI